MLDNKQAYGKFVSVLLPLFPLDLESFHSHARNLKQTNKVYPEPLRR